MGSPDVVVFALDQGLCQTLIERFANYGEQVSQEELRELVCEVVHPIHDVCAGRDQTDPNEALRYHDYPEGLSKGELAQVLWQVMDYSRGLPRIPLGEGPTMDLAGLFGPPVIDAYNETLDDPDHLDQLEVFRKLVLEGVFYRPYSPSGDFIPGKKPELPAPFDANNGAEAVNYLEATEVSVLRAGLEEGGALSAMRAWSGLDESELAGGIAGAVSDLASFLDGKTGVCLLARADH